MPAKKGTPRGVGVALDQGARDNQEDCAEAHLLPGGVLALALADGMGGHAAGEVASTTAIRAFFTSLTQALPASGGDWETALKAALNGANAALQQAIEADEELDGMGCTFVGVLTDCERYAFVSMGDSPAFVSGAAVRRVNTDHSMRGAAERQAKATGESLEKLLADVHPHALTSALVGEALDIDALRRADELDVVSGVFGPGERLIIASDGIESLTPEAFDALARRRDVDAETHARLIVDAVLRVGAARQDNVSVVVLDPMAARRRASPFSALLWLTLIAALAGLAGAGAYLSGMLPVR